MKRSGLLFCAVALLITTATSQTEMNSYIETASELTSRARANVYFTNSQSIFSGVQVSFVNVGTGNITFLRRDIVTAGRIPLVLARVYDSNYSEGDDFGPGWSLSCTETVSIREHVARLSTENGAIVEFREASPDKFVLLQDRPSDYRNLVRPQRSTIRTTLRTGFTKEFTLLGELYRLTKVIDRSGNEVRLIYKERLLSRLQNENHFIQLFRNEQGRIVRAEDDQGRRIQYSYGDGKQLTETDDLSGAPWKYAYTANRHLESATDPMGRLNFAAAYNEDGRVTRVRLPSGIVRYEFDANAHSTTVTDRRQHVSRFFQNAEGVTTRVVNALGEETSIYLDANRNPISFFRNGNLAMKFEYDQDHHLTKRETFGPSGPTEIRYKYDPATGLLADIDAPGTVSQSFTYDAHGNLTGAMLADGLHKYSYFPSVILPHWSWGN